MLWMFSNTRRFACPLTLISSRLVKTRSNSPRISCGSDSVVASNTRKLTLPIPASPRASSALAIMFSEKSQPTKLPFGLLEARSSVVRPFPHPTSHTAIPSGTRRSIIRGANSLSIGSKLTARASFPYLQPVRSKRPSHPPLRVSFAFAHPYAVPPSNTSRGDPGDGHCRKRGRKALFDSGARLLLD